MDDNSSQPQTMTTESMRSNPVISFGQPTAERYRSLVEDTSDGFYAFEAVTGRFVFLNGKSCDLLGFSNREALKRTIWEVIVPIEHHLFQNHLSGLIEDETRPSGRGIYTLLRKDLSTFRAEISTASITYKGRSVVQGTLRDVTDYEDLQKQIDHFQRMETIATMVGGLSNQFGNALTVIRSNVTLLEQLCASEKQPARHLAQIRGALHRLDGLTHYMLAFARGGDPRPEAISLNNFVTKILPLISYSAPSGIRFMTKLSEDLPTVRADTTHLQMVLTAVVANAEEAIEGRGRILISTRKTDPEPVFFDCNADLKPGNYVCLSIADTGKGMDEPTRKRVCEPFFTTKLHSRGLGMAAVYGMVKKQGGWLAVQSEPGRGTTVSIFLQAQDAESNT